MESYLELAKNHEFVVIEGCVSPVTESAGPIVLLVAGPLADRVFEPGMGGHGWLRSGFGWLVGTEPGAGMAVIFVLTGLLSLLVGVLGFAVPWLRQLGTGHPGAQRSSATIRRITC